MHKKGPNQTGGSFQHMIWVVKVRLEGHKGILHLNTLCGLCGRGILKERQITERTVGCRVQSMGNAMQHERSNCALQIDR